MGRGRAQPSTPFKHASHTSHAKKMKNFEKKLRPPHHQQEDEVDVSKRSK
jgi:hypothetical protein